MSKPINSRKKGAAYEREIVHELRDAGYVARRGQQYCGANGDPDVVAPDFPFHLELKRVERLDLYGAMTQAISDSQKVGKPPCVVHRKNNSESLFTCRFQDILALVSVIHNAEPPAHEGKGPFIIMPNEKPGVEAANLDDDQ